MSLTPIAAVVPAALALRGTGVDQPEPVDDIEDRLIPKRFREATLDNYAPVTPSQVQALNAVRDWLQATKAGAMLALIGETGVGKSHLLYGAARFLLQYFKAIEPKEVVRLRLQAPLVAGWPKLSNELRWGRSVQTEAASRTVEGNEVRDAMYSRDVILLDEIRPTSGTGFDDCELAKLAIHAYDARIAVLVTTNVHPLSLVMGGPAASRFAQVVITGPDARQ